MTAKEVRLVTLATIALMLLPIVLAGYEENIREGIFLVRPDNEYIPETSVPIYLENEDLTFFACLETEDVPIRLSVLCLDNNDFADIDARPWGELNCYLGSLNLKTFDCANAVVQADYVTAGENLKITQPIKINKFSKTFNRLIETQFTDGGWETALDTAYGLFALSYFPDIFPQRIERAIEYLKLNRHEEDKCWPTDQCRISTTANILFLLEKGGFEDLRIQHDGALYLEKTQNYLNDVNWTVNIGDHKLNENNTINTSCVFDDDGTLTTFTLSIYPSTKNMTVDAEYLAHIGIACTENVYVSLINHYDELLLSYQGDNFSYDIPGACWTMNNEHINCDLRATGLAANTGIDSAHATAAKSYLGSLLIEDRTAGKHLTNNWSVFNDALYLHTEPSSKSHLIESLLYQQKNNGSWSTNGTYYPYSFFEVSDLEYARLESEIIDNVTKDIVTTSYAVMALLENGFERDDEPILDAERWASLVEEETSLNFSDDDLTDEDVLASYARNKSRILNDTKRNAMAFYVLKHNARPVLIAKPPIVEMTASSLELDIVNPTIFELEDLEYEFSDDLEPYLQVEDKDYVDAYSFRRVTISRKKETPVDEIGYLKVSIGSNEYFKVPVILETAPRFNITLPERITVFGSSAILPFQLTKSNHNFTCSIQWSTSGISSTSSFDINDANKTYNFPVKFAILETENKVYEGEATCVASGVTFKMPFATNIIRFSSRPIQVFPELVFVNSSKQSQWITVKNLLDESIEITIAPTGMDPYLVISDTFLSLYPGEARNLTVQVIPPEGENYTTSNSLVFTTFNIEERVLIDAEIYVEEGFSLPYWAWIVMAFFAVSILSVGGFFGYAKREDLKQLYRKYFKKENIEDKVFKQVQQVEKEEELIAIRNMIRILKLQGIGDVDIKKRLKGEGYSEQNINEALQYSDKKVAAKKVPAKKTS